MAASCLKEKADVTENNGVKTMTVYTQPMTMAGITASMQTLSVQQKDGSYKDAEIVEKDAEGNPTAFRFTVPSDEEFIPVQVNPMVEMMGNQPMDARIKVTWPDSTEKDAPDATSSATAKETEKEEPSETTTQPAALSNLLPSLNSGKNELADGTYTVGVQLWHAEKDQASMAASSLKPEARIVVQNGKATMYIYTQPMTFGNITASLQELKVQMTDGTWKDATVASRSSDGNPTSFRFELPAKEDYIPVQVNPHVEMMGNRFLDARIKVDWSSLKTAATDSTEDPNGNTTTAATTAQVTGTGYDTSGTKASGVDTADHSDWNGMVWYAVAIGALTFFGCSALVKRGWVE